MLGFNGDASLFFVVMTGLTLEVGTFVSLSLMELSLMQLSCLLPKYLVLIEHFIVVPIISISVANMSLTIPNKFECSLVLVEGYIGLIEA